MAESLALAGADLSAARTWEKVLARQREEALVRQYLVLKPEESILELLLVTAFGWAVTS